MPNLCQLSAVLRPGHQVASGQAQNSPYAAGTIVLQTPFFLARGLDLRAFFAGTLNLDIAPYRFALREPAWRFERLRWTDKHPPETFSFARCELGCAGKSYAAWIYYPHPETKQMHFQAASTLEVIAPWIEGLAYGDALELRVSAQEVALSLAEG